MYEIPTKGRFLRFAPLKLLASVWHKVREVCKLRAGVMRRLAELMRQLAEWVTGRLDGASA